MLSLFLFAVCCLLFAVCVKLTLAQDRLEADAKGNYQLLSERLWRSERQVAAQEAALELAEMSRKQTEQATTNLSIMHAASLTDMREEIRKLRADRVWIGRGDRGVS